MTCHLFLEPYGRPVCDTDSRCVMPAKRARNVRETCVMPCAKHAKRARNTSRNTRNTPRNVRETRRHTPFHHLPAFVSHYGCTLRPQKYPYNPHKMITTHFPPFSASFSLWGHSPDHLRPSDTAETDRTPPRRRRETARIVRETCVMHCAKHAKCARNTPRNTRNTPRNAASYASHTCRP